jgi:hypothetical protein
LSGAGKEWKRVEEPPNTIKIFLARDSGRCPFYGFRKAG